MRRTSEETKTIILAAARERFAADGFDRATIRAIASDAKIDPAMVMRYFGNKDRLFAAAAEFDLELPDLREIPHEQIGTALVGHFLNRWEGDEALMILIRAGVTNEAVAQRMQGIFAGQLLPVILKFSGDQAEAPTRAGMVSSQLLGMALCRYVLEFPPVVAMTHAELIAWIGPTIQRYLTGDRPAG